MFCFRSFNLNPQILPTVILFSIYVLLTDFVLVFFALAVYFSAAVLRKPPSPGSLESDSQLHNVRGMGFTANKNEYTLQFNKAIYNV